LTTAEPVEASKHSKNKDYSYMNDKFESQKETLLSIKQEISLLYQQVNYLLRNEKPLELLDLDVLMNRTHTLYDRLCSINVGDESLDEDLPFDAEAFSGLFGGMMQEEPQDESENETVSQEEDTVAEIHHNDPEPLLELEPEPQPVIELEPETEPSPEPQFVPEPEPQPIFEPEPEPHFEPVLEIPIEMEPQPSAEVVEEPVVEAEPQAVEEEKAEAEAEPKKPLGDEFGFFFRFEDMPEEEKAPEETKEPEGKVVHVMEAIPEEEIPERDRVHGDDLVQDNPLVMPRLDEEIKAEKEEIERQSSEGVTGVFGEEDDAEFELSTGETLGEKMMGEDNSLAAKLQQTPGRDLKSSIGINDKFLFVNELFGGSMEKYTKSIENLNDLKTLNGAMIYLNELKIELQWNSSNEAYLKLKDLVSRKFE
jgi:hypothetical protein